MLCVESNCGPALVLLLPVLSVRLYARGGRGKPGEITPASCGCAEEAASRFGRVFSVDGRLVAEEYVDEDLFEDSDMPRARSRGHVDCFDIVAAFAGLSNWRGSGR